MGQIAEVAAAYVREGVAAPLDFEARCPQEQLAQALDRLGLRRPARAQSVDPGLGFGIVEQRAHVGFHVDDGSGGDAL